MASDFFFSATFAAFSASSTGFKFKSGIVAIITLGLLCQQANSATLATDAKTVHALNWAVHQWEKALGHKIPTPALYHGESLEDCNEPDDLACSTIAGNRIIVVEQMDKKTLRSVMLHEMGHMLGLDDIEGDLIMEPRHNHNSTKLTAVDVFMARILNNWL